MYDYLEGRVAARFPTRLVLDVGGVGYELAVPVGAGFDPPGAERVKVFTHFVVREDDQRLYGFADKASRDLFRQILRVRGVGPNLALSLLSGLGHTEFLRAVVGDDAAALTRVKGIGKKTAEQILLDLGDRAQALLAEAEAEAGSAPAGVRPQALPAAGNLEDAVGALVSLGFSEKDARKSVERAAASVDASDLEQLVKSALQG